MQILQAGTFIFFMLAALWCAIKGLDIVMDGIAASALRFAWWMKRQAEERRRLKRQLAEAAADEWHALLESQSIQKLNVSIAADTAAFERAAARVSKSLSEIAAENGGAR